MCGIVGLAFNAESATAVDQVLSMRDKIAHRGPDDVGIYRDDLIVIGHVRLSILDLSNLAAQPMVSHTGRYVIAYNGETYNFVELRAHLEEKGVVFRSSGDTETVVEYIEHFGIERCLHAMEGMFAFAVWDRQEKSLILARDRHGIKPLYYSARSSGGFAFASEMKALLDYSRGPDATSLNAAMLGLGCAYREHTLLKGIFSVRAGEYIAFRAPRTEPKKHYFFRLQDFVNPTAAMANERLSAQQVVDCVHGKLRESMRLCMISDAPVAVLASGGVDSSLIAAMANKLHPNIKLYHADVLGASETPAAQELAKHLKCDLFTAQVSLQDTLDLTPVVTYHYEMPLMYHSNAVPFYLVSRLASSHGIKVVLTGEGSDEYFIGYAHMVIYPWIQKYQNTLAAVQKILHKIPHLGRLLWPRHTDSLAEQLRHFSYRYELQERRSEADELYSFIRHPSKRLLQVMSLDMCIGNIPPLLHRNDRLGMAWGIESRFPFLGHGLAALALNLSPKFKVRIGPRAHDWRHPFIIDKWCIRHVAAQYLPRHLAFRGKYAFRAKAYERLSVAPTFFANGFVADYYGLDSKAISYMVSSCSTSWLQRLFLLENWGRIFARREAPDEIRDRIRRHVQITHSVTQQLSARGDFQSTANAVRVPAQRTLWT